MPASRSFSGSASRWRAAWWSAPLLALLFCLVVGPVRAAEETAVAIRFEGNVALAEAELKEAAARELDDFLSRDAHRLVALDDAAYLMERLYRERGYPFAEVEYRYHPGDREALLLIDEGVQVRIEALILEGNSRFDDQLLLSLLAEEGEVAPGSLYVASALRDGLDAIRDQYYNEGFREATVAEPRLDYSPDRTRVRVRIVVHEGARWLVKGVRLPAGVPGCVAEQLQEPMAELAGKPFFRRRLLLLKSRVAAACSECGYPAPGVEVTVAPGLPPQATELVVEVEPGQQVTVAGITVSGNQRTAVPFILKQLALRNGELFRESLRRQSVDNLYRTGLFSKVEIGLGGTADEARRPLLVRVGEGLAREFFVEAGWGSYELLRGAAGYEDANLLGHGRRLRLAARGSMKGGGVEAGINDPWLLDGEITADLPLFYRYREEPSFSRREAGGSLYLSHRYANGMEATLGYLFRNTAISAIEADVAAEGLDNGYNTASVTLQLTRDSRNDYFFPTGGTKVYGALDLADEVVGSSIAFTRFTGGVRHFLPISPLLTLALRYDAGLILPGRNETNIPLGERFFGGGESSVRSFSEGTLGPKDLAGNPVGGVGYNLLSVELRRQLTDRFAASLFWDCGNLSPNRSRAEENKSGAAS
ncbi:MAG: BamA/TamA family outer membrane protein, partial [Desulfobulbaceae bacterium]|nr:BamA/TamA family outer membrane protein [Desulfobulbaceae bacterium]